MWRQHCGSSSGCCSPSPRLPCSGSAVAGRRRRHSCASPSSGAQKPLVLSFACQWRPHSELSAASRRSRDVRNASQPAEQWSSSGTAQCERTMKSCTARKRSSCLPRMCTTIAERVARRPHSSETRNPSLASLIATYEMGAAAREAASCPRCSSEPSHTSSITLVCGSPVRVTNACAAASRRTSSASAAERATSPASDVESTAK
mmetsp:Transcript_42515/g.117685  ORF Transcript_42515/g.117685 Transcript_42515/m.117685 type:complete len:204 (+) Transcript_42515:267-878(+)